MATSNGPPFQPAPYRTPSTVVSDAVYQVIRGCIYGGVWGMVTPFHAPGSAEAIKGPWSGVAAAMKMTYL
jgi:hypothetical protein